MRIERLWAIGLCFFAMLMISMACSAPRQSSVPQTKEQELVAQKDINDVLRAHDKELMAIPGVVGVAVGLMQDDETLCLKVLVVKKTDELKKIPESLEGYPVVIEESGVIRPLQDKTR